MILGEAPGKREDDSGVPFVGRSGFVLDKALDKFGLSREQIYIGNAVSCRPPDNRKPNKREVKACRHWVDRQLETIQPKFVLLLGNTPLESLTGKGGIKKRRGRPWEQDGIIYLATYHPTFVLRDERARIPFEADIELFSEIVKSGKIPREEGLNWAIVDSRVKFEEMLEDLHGTVSFDVETTGLYAWDDASAELPRNPNYPDVPRYPGIVSLGFGTRTRQWCLPIGHPGGPRWRRAELKRMFQAMDAKLRDCVLVAHNGKFDSNWLNIHHDVDWRCAFDTMLAHYLLDENSFHDLKLLAQTNFGAPNFDDSLALKHGAEGKLEEHCLYLSHDVFYTRKLRFKFGKQLSMDRGVSNVFEHILQPCARLFVKVERHGFYVDMQKFHSTEEYLNQRIAEAKEKLSEFGDINWGSRDQVAKLLFDDLGIEPLELTKTGKPSTSESVMLRIDHPVSKALLEFRGAKQQLSFFIDGWKPFLVDGRIHPSFKLHGTVTGRPSCEHPNLQQVPRDRRIRSLITAPPGWTLLEADLSQIEMRIAAELSGDEVLIDAFDKGVDVHWLTALRELQRASALKELVIATGRKHLERMQGGVDILTYGAAMKLLYAMGPDAAAELNDEWKEVRKKAKAVNFGYLFGMWWKKFKIYARDNYGVVVTDQQAQESRKNFFDLYTGLGPWHDRQRRYAQRNGYVRALSGRMRRLPLAMSPDDTPERAEAQRQAINSPVQCFANELNLMTAIQLDEEYPEVVCIVGTVHDAILAEVRNDYVVEVANRTLEIMKRPAILDKLGVKLRVPVIGEVKLGPWGSGVSLEKWEKANGKVQVRAKQG